MKKQILIILLFLLSILVMAEGSVLTLEEMNYNKALLSEGSKYLRVEEKIRVWEHFIEKYNEGKFEKQAKERLNLLTNILNADNIENLYKKNLLKEMQDITNKEKIKIWEDFNKLYPSSLYMDKAINKIKDYSESEKKRAVELYNETMNFEEKDKGDSKSKSLKWKQFLEIYPKSKFTNVANEKMKYWEKENQRKELEKLFNEAVNFYKEDRNTKREKVNKLIRFMNTEFENDAKMYIDKLNRNKDFISKKLSLNLAYGANLGISDGESFSLKNSLIFGLGYMYYFNENVGLCLGSGYIQTGFKDGGDMFHVPFYINSEYKFESGVYFYGSLGGALTSYDFSNEIRKEEADAFSPYFSTGLGIELGTYELELYYIGLLTKVKGIKKDGHIELEDENILENNIGFNVKLLFNLN